MLPDVPGVLPEVPHFEEQQGTLLAETDTERTYLIHTDIVIPNGDNPRPPRGFAYTITVPVPLYFEDGQYLFIPGHFKTTFSDEQPPLKLGDLAPVLFYPGNGTPEDHVFFDEVDEALGGELIEQGTMELDDGRTLYYCHYHVDHEGGPGEAYVAAVGLGGGFFPSFAFQMYDGYTPAEWWDLSVFTSILASVKPYDGE